MKSLNKNYSNAKLKKQNKNNSKQRHLKSISKRNKELLQTKTSEGINSSPKKLSAKITKKESRTIQFQKNDINNKKNLTRQTIFPIITYDEKNRYRVLATGFFINEMGWFITARHVVMEKDDKTGAVPYESLIAIQILSDSTYKEIPVQAFYTHENADIVVGKLAEISIGEKDLDNPALILKKDTCKQNEETFTYAYPNSKIKEINAQFQVATFTPNLSEGKVIEIQDRDDFVKGKLIHTNMAVDSGASGGPVFDDKGYVLGANSTGYAVLEGAEPISFVTPIEYALEIEVPYEETTIKLKNLIHLGGIHIEK